MSKILIFSAVLIAGMSCFFIKPSLSTSELTAKKKPSHLKEIELSESPKSTTQVFLQNSSSKLIQLSDNELRQKLKLLNLDLQENQFKNYTDFSQQDLQHYNQLVRESVQIKKILFLRKYSRRNDT